MSSFLELAISTAVIYGALALVGHALICLLNGFGSQFKSQLVAFPVIGLCAIQIISWNSLYYLDVGLKIWLLGIFAIAALISTYTTFLRNRTRITLRSIGDAVGAPAVSLVFLLIQWRALLGESYFTASSTNGDIVSYANIGTHILEKTFLNTGNLNGANFGLNARTDVFGGYVLVSLGKLLLARTIDQVMLPVLCVAVMLLAHSIFKLIRNSTEVNELTAILISVVPQTTFMFSYLMGNYFLAQIIASTFVVSLFASMVLLREANDEKCSKNQLVLIVVALLFAGLLLTYPHMAFVVTPLIGAIFVIGRRPKQIAKFGIRVFVASCLGAFMVVARFGPAIRRFLFLASDQANGWPLPGILPSQLLGFQSSESEGSSTYQWIGSALLLLLVLLSSWYLRKHQRVRLPIISTVALTLGSYAVIYQMSGPSYRQWKWITFYAPLVIAALLIPIVGFFFCKRFEKRSGPKVVIALLALLTLNNLRNASPYMGAIANLEVKPTEPMTHLDQQLKKLNIRDVNVHLGPYLESMWPSLFISAARVSILDPSYYPVAGPQKSPTVVAVNTELLPNVRRINIGSNYWVVPFPSGRTSDDVAGLKATTKCAAKPFHFDVAKSGSIHVHLTNNGQSTWLGSGAFKGAVNLGARELLSNGEKKELVHQLLAPFPNYVAPGQSLEANLEVSFGKPGTYRLEITPVSEQVAWFSNLDQSSSCIATIVVTE